jgi:hypothetical protein
MDNKFLNERATVLRELAEQADPFHQQAVAGAGRQL